MPAPDSSYEQGSHPHLEISPARLHAQAGGSGLPAIELAMGERMIVVGSPELRAFRLVSQEKIMQARRLHAQAYAGRGYVTPEGINEEGTLIESIDPLEVVRASTYIGTVEDGGLVTGCIRMIEPSGDDLFSLPTMAKIASVYGREASLFSSLPFTDQSKVFEGSALGRVSDADDPTIMSRLLLAMRSEAAERGFGYCVVGLVDSTARLIRMAYGGRAFRRIGDENAIITLNGQGLRQPDGVKLEAYYVEVDTFIDDCLEYFGNPPKGAFARTNKAIFEVDRRFAQSMRSA